MVTFAFVFTQSLSACPTAHAHTPYSTNNKLKHIYIKQIFFYFQGFRSNWFCVRLFSLFENSKILVKGSYSMLFQLYFERKKNKVRVLKILFQEGQNKINIEILYYIYIYIYIFCKSTSATPINHGNYQILLEQTNIVLLYLI